MRLRRAFMWRLPALVDQVGKQHGNAVQGGQDDDRYDDAAADEVLRRCVAVFTHGGAIIEQQYQEHQRRRQQRHGDHLHEQGDENQRCVRNENHQAGGDEHEEVRGVEPWRLADPGIERVRPSEDLAEGPGARERDADCAQQAGIEQADGQEGANVAVGLHQLGGRLRGAVDIDAGKHGPGHDYDEDGDDHGDDRAEQWVEATPRDVLLEHALVDDRTLLEEQHPRSDRGTDVGHEEKEQLAVEAAGQIRNQTLVHHVLDGRVHQKGTRDIDQVQDAEQQRQLLERPVPAVQDDNRHQQGDRDDGEPGGHAEYGEGRRHADEFGDQRQPIDNHQVQEREPAPERSETIEYGLRVATLGNGAQAYGHLLDVVGDRYEDQQEPDQVVTVLRPGSGVGCDAARIVIRHHDDDARTGENQIESNRLPGLPKEIVELREEIHAAAVVSDHAYGPPRRCSQAQIAQAGMILGSRAGGAPAVLAIRRGDGNVVDGGEAPAHQPGGVELPVLVAVGAEPVSRVVVPLVGETHRDAVLAERPDFLDEPVIELAAPLAAQELLDGRAPVQKLGTVAPQRVLRVRERYALRIAAVPGVLGHPHLGDRARPRERRLDGRDRRRRARCPVSHVVSSVGRALRRTTLTPAPASASSAARHSAKFEPAAP